MVLAYVTELYGDGETVGGSRGLGATTDQRPWVP